jgi:very-short-patch-repair endonuclease/rubrerythrin
MKKLTTKEFIDRSNKVHNYKYDYSKSNYIGSDFNIDIICPIHGEFTQPADEHMRGHGCKKCGIEKYVSKKRNKLEDLIKRANIIHNNKYIYDKIKDHTSMTDDVLVTCPKHGDFPTCLHYHINKKRCCPKCDMENRTDDNEKFIEKARKVHGDKYNYSLVDYKRSKIKVDIICPVHGIFPQKPCDHLNARQGCPICSESKGELKISKYLKENDIIFERQKKFNDCRHKGLLSFDFYLPEYNLCIEFDGEQHYRPILYWGKKAEEAFKEIQLRDKIKTDYCKNNKIGLLRIKYNEDIIEKLEEFIF